MGFNPQDRKRKQTNQLKKTDIHAGRCSTPRTGKESKQINLENSNPRRSLCNPQDWKRKQTKLKKTDIHAGRCSTPRTGKESKQINLKKLISTQVVVQPPGLEKKANKST